MKLNILKPAKGSRSVRKRVGRGQGSGNGKMAGRGHKGQKSRSGGFHKVGFEGGQMPLQRRLPKIGFSSRKSQVTAEIRLDDLSKIDASTISISVLKDKGLISKKIRFVKVINSGVIDKVIKLEGIRATSGAKSAIESHGGSMS